MTAETPAAIAPKTQGGGSSLAGAIAALTIDRIGDIGADARDLLGRLARWSSGKVTHDCIDRASVASAAPGWVATMADGAVVAYDGDDSPAVLRHAWEQAGWKALAASSSNFAAIVVEPEGSLLLARSLHSTNPLFYTSLRGLAAAATLPEALRGLSGKDLPDLDRLALLAAEVFTDGQQSVYRGIEEVPHGSVLRLDRAKGPQLLWRWSPSSAVASSSVAQAGEGLRAALDHTIRAIIEPVEHSSLIASELSGGRDSAAVATSLHAVAPDRPILALTAAPSRSFAPDAGSPRMSDESAFARLVAKAMPGSRHLVVRPDPPVSMERFSALSRLHHRPLVALSQFPWFDPLMQAAQQAGAALVLNGNQGNFTVSRGGTFFLPDYWRRHGASETLARCLAVAGRDRARWRSLLHSGIGSVLPRPVYTALMAVTGHGSAPAIDPVFLRFPYREHAKKVQHALIGDPRPPRDAGRRLWSIFMANDPGERFNVAAYGLRSRDPTASRVVADFLCSVDPAMLMPGQTSERPLYEAAFGRRVPRTIIENRRRGSQVSDWFLHFPVAVVRERWSLLGKNGAVAELFDLTQIECALDEWPASVPHQGEVIARYRGHMLTSLAVAEWLAVHFPD